MRSLARHLLALILTTPPLLAAGPNLPPGTRFIFSHFVHRPSEQQDERLYISCSPDGLTWQTLNNGQPVWQPPGWNPFGEVVRDPAIIYEGGWFWVAYTSGNYGKHQSFGLVKSTDLLNWTFVGEIPAPRPGATDQLTWNPVWFRDGDGSIHLFISLSLTGGTTYYPVPDMQVHEMHPLNADFTQWSAPVLVQLPTANTNELWVWKEGATYHAFYVDLPDAGRHYCSTSMNLITGWSPARPMDLYTEEGGMMMPRPEGGYRVFVETGYSGLPPTYRFYDFNAALTTRSEPQNLVSSAPMKNGKMIAAPGTTTFADWQSQKLAGLPSAEQSPAADPDGDGRPNLLEYATGLDPKLSAEPTTPVRFAFKPDHLTVAYRRLPSLKDITYTMEAADGSLSFATAEGTLLPRAITLLSDGSELVDLVDTVAVSAGGRRFLRLQVTLTNP